MKRELIQNILPVPVGETEEAIDRSGFLSAVAAIRPKGSGEVTIKVTHSDTKEGEFVEVPDKLLAVDGNSVEGAADGDLLIFDLDLVGCKPFIKVKFEGDGVGSSAPTALVLGDAAETPVEAPDSLGK